MSYFYAGLALLFTAVALAMLASYFLRFCPACEWRGLRLTRPDRCPRCREPL